MLFQNISIHWSDVNIIFDSTSISECPRIYDRYFWIKFPSFYQSYCSEKKKPLSDKLNRQTRAILVNNQVYWNSVSLKEQLKSMLEDSNVIRGMDSSLGSDWREKLDQCAALELREIAGAENGRLKALFPCPQLGVAAFTNDTLLCLMDSSKPPLHTYVLTVSVCKYIFW